MSTPEQHRPPVYACAAGAVLHAHAGDTLEPAVLLHTFLPAETTTALREAPARVDVHSDGPTSPTATVRVLVDGHSLSWQLPVAPLVAALPGQSGDDGRVVLLAVVDAEPAPGSWGEAVDCERLAAELPLPVAEVVEALRGRLAPWLAEDVELLLHDDAHDHAADQSPHQLLATAVCAHYRGSLDADLATGRLLRGLSYGPPDFQSVLASLVATALATSTAVAGPDGVAAVLAETGPFEDEATRLLTELPATDSPAAAGEVLINTPERDEAVRAAVGVVARLARAGLGPDLPDDALLRALGMLDDAAVVRLATLWLRLAQAVLTGADDDAAATVEVAAGVRVAGEPGREWLHRVAALLVEDAEEVAGRALHRVGAPLELVRTALAAAERGGGAQPELEPLVHACLQLARFTRARAGIAPGSWVELPLSAVVHALGLSLAADRTGDGGRTDLELLGGLLEPDLEPVEALDALVCATAQLVVQAGVEAEADLGAPVVESLGSVRAGARWLAVAMLRAAHEHDPAAPDLTTWLRDEPERDVDRTATRTGLAVLWQDGVHVLRVLGDALGPVAGVSGDEVLSLVLPAALAEHDLLRQPR